MLKGTMEVLEDMRPKEMIWRDGDATYFNRVSTDPGYCVIEYTAKEGRYYYYSDFESEALAVEQDYGNMWT